MLDSVSSTNTWAINAFKENRLEPSSLVTAQQQTDGRGQPGNSWIAPSGSLAFSILLPTQPSGLLALAMANSAAKAIAEIVGEDRLTIKWPNDLMVDERKLGGLLIEHVVGTPSAKRATVVGLGLNLNNQPPSIDGSENSGLVKIATSLREVFGRAFPLETTLASIAGTMLKQADRIELDQPQLIADCESRFKYLGQRIRLRKPSGEDAIGLVQGFSAIGELVLDLGGEKQLFQSGQIVEVLSE